MKLRGQEVGEPPCFLYLVRSGPPTFGLAYQELEKRVNKGVITQTPIRKTQSWINRADEEKTAGKKAKSSHRFTDLSTVKSVKSK